MYRFRFVQNMLSLCESFYNFWKLWKRLWWVFYRVFIKPKILYLALLHFFNLHGFVEALADTKLLTSILGIWGNFMTILLSAKLSTSKILTSILSCFLCIHSCDFDKVTVSAICRVCYPCYVVFIFFLLRCNIYTLYISCIFR